MPHDQGMLFDFGDDVPVMMWMKNTYIPLDMVFISREGVVLESSPNATPMSEDMISSAGWSMRWSSSMPASRSRSA